MITIPSRRPFVRVAVSNIHEFGVFAAKPFAPLDVVLEIDATRLGLSSAGDASHVNDAPEHHINHSCEPNAFIKAVDGVHYVFALREIASGKEVVIDYAINRGSVDHVVVPCNCGSEYCRGDVQLGYFDLPVTLQVAYLPLLEEWFLNRHTERVTELCRLDLAG